MRPFLKLSPAQAKLKAFFKCNAFDLQNRFYCLLLWPKITSGIFVRLPKKFNYKPGISHKQISTLISMKQICYVLTTSNNHRAIIFCKTGLLIYNIQTN
jgi:hypothetical protein